MILLSREIRFSLSKSYDPNISNSWAGWPRTNRIVPWLVLRCVVRGTPDPTTGYVCNVKSLDNLLRDIVTEHLMPDFDSQQTAEQLIRIAFENIIQTWQEAAMIVSVELRISPYLSFSIDSGKPAMTMLTQQFEFSAAHRLHCDSLSEQENRNIFGKCNNLHGHGHNYVVDISVENETDQSTSTASVLPLAQFESTVKRLIIDRLDHKHLNHDIEYFEQTNPSVENIAIAIWDWLDGQFGAAKLTSVRVYETPKTWAEYHGPVIG